MPARALRVLLRLNNVLLMDKPRMLSLRKDLPSMYGVKAWSVG
jgi:hypothetical protein